jgi:hypothetical protein
MKLAFAIAQEEVAAGHFSQHPGEIFCRHDLRRMRQQVAGLEQRRQALAKHLCIRSRINQRYRQLRGFKFDFDAERVFMALGDFYVLIALIKLATLITARPMSQKSCKRISRDTAWVSWTVFPGTVGSCGFGPKTRNPWRQLSTEHLAP